MIFSYSNEGTDNTRRVLNHIFHQKSFYPLRPPKIPLDQSLAYKMATLNTLPNLLILPSSVKEFIRDYNNCLCINPGRLYGEQTGKFARVVIHPPENENTKLFHYVAGQVIKI